MKEEEEEEKKNKWMSIGTIVAAQGLKGDIRIKMFIHSIAFGTLKKMIGEDDILNKKNIEMTLDTMCNNIIYWTQDLFNANLFKQGSHILSMTSAGGHKNWESYGAISMAIAAINLKSDEKDVKHIRMAKIKSDTKQFEKVSNEELAKYAQAVGGSSK